MQEHIHSGNIPNENVETEIKYVQKIKTLSEDNGVFKITDIEPGKYVLFIDKYNFGDYIITNIEINPNSEINVGTISLTSGDMNKDGVFSNKLDKGPFNLLMQLEKDVGKGLIELSSLGLNFPYDLNDDGKAASNDRNLYTWATNNIENMEIKKVVDFSEINTENN